MVARVSYGSNFGVAPSSILHMSYVAVVDTAFEASLDEHGGGWMYRTPVTAGAMNLKCVHPLFGESVRSLASGFVEVLLSTLPVPGMR